MHVVLPTKPLQQYSGDQSLQKYDMYAFHAEQGTSYGPGTGGGHCSYQISGAAMQPWINGINYYAGAHSSLHTLLSAGLPDDNAMLTVTIVHD